MTARLQKAAKEEMMKRGKGYSVLLIISTIILVALLVINVILLLLTIRMSEELSKCMNSTHPTEHPKTTAMTTTTTTTTTTTAATTAPFTSCNPDEIRFNNSCYFFSSNLHNTWSESQEYCKKKNSDLVVIKSAEKQQFMKLNTAKDGGFYWLGLQYAGAQTWKWVDGTICDVHDKKTTYFVDGKPSPSEPDKDCVYMTYPSGLWNTENCGFNYRWACERKITH